MGDERDLTRRKLLGTTTALAGVGLAGCTGGDGDGGGDGGGDGNSLRISILEDPGSPLNQYISGMGASKDWIHELVHDRLLLPSPSVEEPMPGLAVETTELDPSTFTATVREDVQWQDGEPFTVDDVVFTFRFYRDGPSIRFAHHVSEMPKVDAIEAVDDRTVRFETAFPTPSLAKITFADVPILPKHVWANVENPREYQELPVGTGPYELVEYTQGERLRFEANQDYFLGEPLVDEIVITFISDPSVTFTALKTGEIDGTIRPVPPETLDQFRADDGLRVVEATRLAMVGLLLNYTRQPFTQHGFRFAVSRALDIDDIVDVVMLGKATSGSEGYTHPKSPWTAPDVALPYEPEAARAQLDEMSFRDRNGDGVRETPEGEDLSFSIKVPSNQPQFIRTAQLVKGQLADFGIDTEVISLDPGTIGAEGIWGSQNFDMMVQRYNFHLTSDPDQYVLNHGSNKLLWHTEEFPYPEYESLEEQYIQADTIEKQRSVFHEMNRLYNQQPTIIPVWYPEEHQAFRPAAHDAWAEAPPFGIYHKFSFLPKDARGTAVTKSF